MSFFKSYRLIERPILFVILAEFFIQLVNATFMNLQSLYMKSVGFMDDQIGDVISWRFLGVLVLALPLGLLIKGMRVKPFFYFSAIGVPLFALLIIVCIHFQVNYFRLIHLHASDVLMKPFIPQHILMSRLLILAQLLWGASFTFMQIPVLPFILRNAKPESHTAAISLSYSTWSFAGILSAAIVWMLNSHNPVLFNERNLMAGITVFSFLGIYCVSKIKIEEKTQSFNAARFDLRAHDWNTIAAAVFPALIIATGAGLTIPFINLFFSRVHGLETNTISLWNFFAALLVAFVALIVPRVIETVVYKIAIPVTQSFAVISLVLMATTELYSHFAIAVSIAVGCYLLRQPLMNMAGPMTSEIAMKFVGKKNQEITSALMAAVWSGSWFISTRFIFGSLRKSGYPYVDIFLITAALYTVGILLYVLLIRAYNKKEKAGLIEGEN